MRLLEQFFAASVVALSSAVALAQTGVSPVANGDRNGTIIQSDPQAAANGLRATSDPRIAPEVRERIARFERVRETYLREQERLRNLYRGASTDEERARIRDLIAKTREQFLDSLRSFREDIKDRLPELRQRLPEMNEVLDNARDRARDAANQVRKRRGTD